MIDATAVQVDTLRFISRYSIDNGFPPSLRDLVTHFGLKSTNAAHDRLKALVRKGYLTRRKTVARGIMITAKGHALLARPPRTA